MTKTRSGFRLWLLAFIGFWLLHAAWAFAAPFDGPPDEQQHALRAAAIMNGEILPVEANAHNVPGSLYRWPPCFPMKPTVSAECEAEPGGDESLRYVWVSEARFNPIYYAVTGWPLGPWPNWLGVMLSRLLTGAAMAALLACAVVAAARWTRHRALVAGVVVAVTPMTAHLGGSINPNAVEIAAGVALFAALIAVLHEQREGINRAAVVLAAVSASVLVTPRFSGVMWLVVILGVLLIPSSRARLRELARSRWVRGWAAVVVLATLASVAWTLVAGTVPAVRGDNGWTTVQILRTAVFDHWPNVVNQMIGVMGWAETLMPRLIYVIWFMAAGLLLLGALVMGGLVDRWRLMALFAGTFAPFLVVEILIANQIGWFTQGRYFLPAAVGLPLIAAHVLARRGLSAEHLRTMTRLFALLLLPVHFVCVPFTMVRWQSGFRSINPLEGDWLPPLGAVLPIVTAALAVAVLFVAYWRASRIPVEPAPPAEPEEATEAAKRSPAQTETVSV